MVEILSKLVCSDCGQEFDDTEDSCPQCGSKKLNKHIYVTEHVSISVRNQMKIKEKNVTLPSKKKSVLEYQQGFDESQRTESGYVQKERLIDRINNKYKEVVIDDNGTVLHYCKEPLSDHFGHGSAKNTIHNSHKQD